MVKLFVSISAQQTGREQIDAISAELITRLMPIVA